MNSRSKVPPIANFDTILSSTHPHFTLESQHIGSSLTLNQGAMINGNNSSTNMSVNSTGSSGSTSIYLDILQKHYSPIRAPFQSNNSIHNNSPISVQSNKVSATSSTKSKSPSTTTTMNIQSSSKSNHNRVEEITKETLHSVSTILNKMKQSEELEKNRVSKRTKRTLPSSLTLADVSKKDSPTLNRKRNSPGDRIYPATHRGDVPLRYQQMKMRATSNERKSRIDSQSVEEETARLKLELRNLDTELEERFQIPKSSVSPLNVTSELRELKLKQDEEEERAQKDARLQMQTALLKEANNRNERVNNLLYRNKERYDSLTQEMKEVELRVSSHSSTIVSPRTDTTNQQLRRVSPNQDSRTAIFTKLAEVRLQREQRRREPAKHSDLNSDHNKIHVEKRDKVPLLEVSAPTQSKIDERLQLYRHLKRKQLQKQIIVGEEKEEEGNAINKIEEKRTESPERTESSIVIKSSRPESPLHSSQSRSPTKGRGSRIRTSQECRSPSRVHDAADKDMNREPKRFLDQLLQIDAEITSELKRQNTRLTEELQSMGDAHLKLKKDHDALKKENMQLRSENSHIQKRLTDAERENDRSKNQISLLEKEMEKMESEALLILSNKEDAKSRRKEHTIASTYCTSNKIKVDLSNQGDIYVSLGDKHRITLNEYVRSLSRE